MKNPVLYLAITLLFFGSCLSGFSQQPYIDSLKKVSSTIKDSVERCKIYLELSQRYSGKDSLQFKLYFHKASALLNGFSDPKKKLKAYGFFIKQDINTGNYDQAEIYSEKALKLALQSDNKKSIATIYYYLGCVYLSRGDTQKALDYFMKSSRLVDAIKDEELRSYLNSSFGLIYQRQNQFDSALVYHKKALHYHQAVNKDEEFVMKSLVNIGGVLLAKESYTEGGKYLKEALEIARKRHDQNAEMIILGNMANGYMREGNHVLAEQYALELAEGAKKEGIISQQIYAQTVLATIKVAQQKYDAGILLSKETLVLAYTEKNSPFISTLYEMLVMSYKAKHDYKNAYEYKNLLTHYKDSIAAKENISYIEELKHKYNLQQKNQELSLKTELIKEIEKTNQQKTLVIISLLVVFISGVISVFLFRQRRKIKEELVRKNTDLENQNKNFEAFINGQEQERKRIASDLHDGLAQNLVMLKMGVTNIPVQDTEQQEKLHYYTNEIDRMIEETRKISHNMMPGVLVDLGLLKALKSLINEINTNHPTLSIQLSATTFSAPLSSETEIQLYRVIQELLNNIIKHSKATSCVINLVNTSSTIEIRVSDNGVGFEKSPEKKGIGLQNIYSRIRSIHGTALIDSVPGQGTTVTITIPTV